jgi:Domain of unknown function (DUF4252)
MIPKLSVNACAIAFAVLMPCAASAQGAKIQLDSLNHLAGNADEVVDVSVDAAMLQQTAGFLAGKQSGDAKVRDLIKDIREIHVKVFEFARAGAYSPADVETIRKQVAGPGWSRVVSVREKNELTEIYFWRERGENGGLVLISAEPNELTIVNMVGRVDLASLAAIGPMIPELPTATAGKSK